MRRSLGYRVRSDILELKGVKEITKEKEEDRKAKGKALQISIHNKGTG